ncbi:hypothetical protein BT96DRAFT_974184 [Gymnopus androsaceus JB14]|uniref:Uncharacterized protein n=1 Tax=Gymnopus androsaceus JB14 TaxID=1447944 RepID=A0A6A4I0V7_9AGAR|nr:hypothetical protein BT96DRAFT_974184 [Gymnopus androsaceus JB14]
MSPAGSKDGLPVDAKAFLVSLWVETFFFGLHFILFGFCALVLLRHKRQGYAVLLTTAVCIIIFSATHCSLAFRDSLIRLKLVAVDEPGCPAGSSGSSIENPNQFFGLNARSFAYLMNNFFADALVVYRCYSLWSPSAYYPALPALLVLITTMVGVDGFPCKEAMQLRPAFFVMSLVTNLTVAVLTAGRLYWLSRKQEWHLMYKDEPALVRRYSKAFAILIESGGLYSLGLIIFLAFCANDEYEGAAMIVQSALTQIMGIVPTSIIVIVGLGLQFEHQPPPEAEPLRPRPSNHSRTFSRRSRRSRHKREWNYGEVMNIA